MLVGGPRPYCDACLGAHGELYGADKLVHGRHTPCLQLAVHLQQGRNIRQSANS